jgi:hypothetical protein
MTRPLDGLRVLDCSLGTAGPRAMGWGESDKSVGEQEASVEAGRSAIDQTASKLKPSPGATLAATVAGSSPSSHV